MGIDEPHSGQGNSFPSSFPAGAFGWANVMLSCPIPAHSPWSVSSRSQRSKSRNKARRASTPSRSKGPRPASHTSAACVCGGASPGAVPRRLTSIFLLVGTGLQRPVCGGPSAIHQAVPIRRRASAAGASILVVATLAAARVAGKRGFPTLCVRFSSSTLADPLSR